MVKWFYLEYLGQEWLAELPPIIGAVKIDLLGLYKFVDALGGYMNVSLNNNWHQMAKILGLAYDENEAVKGLYQEYIGMIKVYFEEAKRMENEPKVASIGFADRLQVDAFDAQEVKTESQGIWDETAMMNMHKNGQQVESKLETSTNDSDDFIVIT